MSSLQSQTTRLTTNAWGWEVGVSWLESQDYRDITGTLSLGSLGPFCFIIYLLKYYRDCHGRAGYISGCIGLSRGVAARAYTDFLLICIDADLFTRQ